MKRVYKRGLLKKYLLAFTSIILISFSCLGAILYFFVGNYDFAEKRKILLKNANDISSIISESGLKEVNGDYFFKSEEIIQGMIDTVSQNINSDIIVTDMDKGEIQLCSKKEIKNSSKVIPSPILDKVSTGQYEERTSLGDIYETEHYTVGVPINIEDGGEKKSLIAIFIASDASSIENLRNEMLRLFLLASFITWLIAFFVIWGISYRLVKPLRKMEDITQFFSIGDFSKRVDVTTKDEIGNLENAFNEMAETLEKSENTRKTFIANVSHELKTPMTTISGFIDGIIDGTIDSKNQKHYLLIVSNEIKRLSRLVKSMLNLSKIDSGEVKLIKTKFDLLGVVLNVFTTFEQIIEEKNVEIQGFETCESVFLNADIDLIYQVVYNLVENATKFVNKGGYIKVNLVKKYNNAIFVIKNSGEGISDEDLRHVFDRFYKTDKSRSKDRNGLGLGLYLVKKILNLHGGNVKARSNKENECIFSFFIPIDKK